MCCCATSQVLHVGDRFSDTGNDTATRDCCSIVWVANPEETGFFVKMLLKVRWFAYLYVALRVTAYIVNNSLSCVAAAAWQQLPAVAVRRSYGCCGAACLIHLCCE